MAEEEGKPQVAPMLKNPSAPAESQVDITQLSNKLDALQLERLTELHRNLRETEARIDQKLANFKKFVETTEVAGRSLAGSRVEKSEEDTKKEAAKKLLEGTGLSFE